MKDNISKPKITIGLPSYNGANTIQRAIDSLVNQTYSNFELIISDDDSSDSTSEICQKYKLTDKRIKFIKNKDRKGWINNFIYLLDQAQTEYFMWAAQDDYWDPKFIEKNLEVLESNHKIVGSISDIKLVGNIGKNYYSNPNDINSKMWLVHPIIGTYEEKIQKILEFNWSTNFYSLFRTEQLKKSIPKKSFASWDFAILLKIIKFGDLHVLDETMIFRDGGGLTSSSSIIKLMRKQNGSWYNTYFPYVTYTIFCMKNLGLRVFLKHISHFKYLNIHTGKNIVRELFYKVKK